MAFHPCSKQKGDRILPYPDHYILPLSNPARHRVVFAQVRDKASLKTLEAEPTLLLNLELRFS